MGVFIRKNRRIKDWGKKAPVLNVNKELSSDKSNNLNIDKKTIKKGLESKINRIDIEKFKIKAKHTDTYNEIDSDHSPYKNNVSDEQVKNVPYEKVEGLNTDEYSGYCLFLSLNSTYIIGYRVFIQSFLYHNRWFDGDLVIMDLNLSDEDKEYVSTFYKKIFFIKPNYENYKDVNIDTLYNKNFINNYYKLDIFSYTKYEKIVSMDCDMLITGDLSDLFFKNYSFGAVPIAFRINHEKPPFNGGLIVLDSKFNCESNYNLVLSKIKTPYKFAEQDLLNDLYKNVYTKIDKTYNSEKRLLDSKDAEELNIINNAKVIHFVGGKPWDKVKAIVDLGYEVLENKWHDASEPKVLIIGNSPEVLNKKYGHLIDSFDIIIRINDFSINGYETFIGTKTHYIMCTFATNITKEYEKINPKNIYMFAAEKKDDFDFIEKRFLYEKIDNINILDDYYFQGLNDKIGLTDKQRASTGLIAIEFALNTFKAHQIYFHGIGLNANMYTHNKAHYFDQDGVGMDRWVKANNTYHDIFKEREYLKKLILDKKISKL